MREQRTEPRAPIQLEVAYRRLNSFFADYTKNVSKGGLFVKTSRALPVGSRFEFRLKVPSRPEPLALAADVVYVTGGEGAGMGLRFVWPDERAKAEFDALVEQLVVDQLGPEAAKAMLARGDEPATR